MQLSGLNTSGCESESGKISRHLEILCMPEPYYFQDRESMCSAGVFASVNNHSNLWYLMMLEISSTDLRNLEERI